MAVSLNSLSIFNSSVKHQHVKRYSIGTLPTKTVQCTFRFGTFDSKLQMKEKRSILCLSVPDTNPVLTDAENSKIGTDESEPNTSEFPNGSATSLDSNLETSEPPNSQPTTKKAPLTARERLRAARVLNRYADQSKPSKSNMGSTVLDALKESERGKKRSRLPEAPTNMLDDSKRGMPKQGLTWDLPGGSDLLIIAFSFVFISTIMLGTTYIVWKVGAIHFNEN
ncbi:hypothetical protein ACFE04_018224 [Oxalis oulophora]